MARWKTSLTRAHREGFVAIQCGRFECSKAKRRQLRSRSVSVARYTSEMPLAPSRAVISCGRRRRPILRAICWCEVWGRNPSLRGGYRGEQAQSIEPENMGTRQGETARADYGTRTARRCRKSDPAWLRAFDPVMRPDVESFRSAEDFCHVVGRDALMATEAITDG